MTDAQGTKEERDIAIRLRSRFWEDRHHRRLRDEAAREIERLREEIAKRDELILEYQADKYREIHGRA